MATIIATHIARKDPKALPQLCPGMRIHAIDIVHPPGMPRPPIAAMAAHCNSVSDVPAANSSAATPCRASCEPLRPPGIASPEPRVCTASALGVLIVTAPPNTVLVAAAWRTVEPLVHAPEAIEAACVAGI